MSSRRRNLLPLALLLSILLTASGCGQNQSASQKPQSSTAGQKPPAPAAAEDIGQGLTDIIEGLDRKMKMQETPSLEQSSSSGGQTSQANQGTSSQGGGSQGSSSSGGSSSGGSGGSSSSGGGSSDSGSGQSQPSQPSSQPSGPSEQQKELQSLKNLHRNWNMLEPQAAESGLSDSSRTNFETALDELTLALSKQDLEKSLMSAIELYGQYAQITRIYSMPQPSEFYEVQYGVMAAIAESSQDKWDNASARIEAAMDPWAMLLPQAGKQDKALVQRVDFSLRDLKNAVASQEMDLVVVKGDIAMSNLQALEKKLSQSQSQSGGQ